MGRVVLFVILLGLLAIGAGIVYLGAFPPDPPTREVRTVLPNSRFEPAPQPQPQPQPQH